MSAEMISLHNLKDKDFKEGDNIFLIAYCALTKDVIEDGKFKDFLHQPATFKTVGGYSIEIPFVAIYGDDGDDIRDIVGNLTAQVLDQAAEVTGNVNLESQEKKITKKSW